MWSAIGLKLNSILQEYAVAYAQILQNQNSIKHIAYIDGFAGAGAHISKRSGELIAGSPARALSIQPRFSYYLESKDDLLHTDELGAILKS